MNNYTVIPESRKIKVIGAAIITIVMIVGVFSMIVIFKGLNNKENSSEYGFIGKGTQDSPYLISSVEDLEHFRNLVNEGESFNYKYFKQTEDLDLTSVDNWVPIGVFGTEKYFYGYYDGDGHILSKLKCVGQAENDNVGLFGILCGEVRNLGIESGLIDGACVGSIASHGSVDAVIINCYNKAEVNGYYRAGGIADNFGGTILFCFNMGQVSGEQSAGIVSYNCKEIYSCYSITTDNVVTANFAGKISHSMNLSSQDMNQTFIKKYYKDLSEWNSAYIDKENLCRIVIESGNVRYTQNTYGNIFEFFSSSLGMIIILGVMIYSLMIGDFIINIKRN